MKLFDANKPFFKCNFHAHSTMSDGRRSPEDVMQIYAEHGYDVLALTDHWHVGAAQTCGDMLVIPGVEYDFGFPNQVLHLVCLPPDQACCEGIARGIEYSEVIRRINKCGGVAIAAHPAWSLNTPDFLASLDGVTISEVYNTVSDEPFGVPRGCGAHALDLAAMQGKLFRFVASDDAHYYTGDQCIAYTMLQAEEHSVQGVLDALRAGKFFASQGPAFENIEIENGRVIVDCSPVSRCTFCSNEYWTPNRCISGEGLTHFEYALRPNERFVRVELTDSEGRRAWCSPCLVSAQ